MSGSRRLLAALVLAVVTLLVLPPGMPAVAAAGVPAIGSSRHQDAADGGAGEWLWPVSGPRRVVIPFRAPAHDYGPGHRGVDVAAGVGAEVHAPAAGVVAFRGVVVDRPLMTIEHAGGLVTTFAPVASDLSPGDPVAAGDVIGVVAVGGHAVPGTLHIGLRLHGAYVDPLGLFGPVARAVLLPCCDSR